LGSRVDIAGRPTFVGRRNANRALVGQT
jgi:hypothetical protein